MNLLMIIFMIIYVSFIQIFYIKIPLLNLINKDKYFLK